MSPEDGFSFCANPWIAQILAQSWKQTLLGATCNGGSLQGTGVWSFNFTLASEEQVTLRFYSNKHFSAAFLAKWSHNEQGRNVLPKEIVGLQIIDVKAIEGDRSIVLYLDQSYILQVRLYGKNGNIIIFKDDDAFFSLRANLNKDLSAVTLLPFKFGSENDFLDKLLSDETTTRRLNRLFNYQEEIHQRDIINLYLKKPMFSLYNTRDPLKKCTSVFWASGIVNCRTNDVNTALSWLVNGLNKHLDLQERRLQKVEILKEKIKGATKNLKSAQATIDASSHSLKLQRDADLLLAYIHVIKPGDLSVTLQDFYTGEDVALSWPRTSNPSKAAQIWYTRAKAITQRAEVAKAKLDILQTQISQLEVEMDLIAEGDDVPQIVKKGDVKEQSLPKGVKYHTFIIDGYKVIVGKNALSNDWISTKGGKPSDLWFHAGGKSGAHVVVSTNGGTPHSALLEKVAQLAAYFSEGKNSALCPVSYTQWKHVRKPRKANPGEVSVTNEKSLMVMPALPNDTEASGV